MKPKILFIIEDGKLRVWSNGDIEVYFEHMENLNGIERVEVMSMTNEKFDALVCGKEQAVIL